MKTADTGSARACWDGTILTVSTGRAVREWKLTDRGFVTIRLSADSSGYQWIESSYTADDCDWSVFTMTGCSAQLTNIEIRPVEDRLLTAPFVEVTAHFEYRESGMALVYSVWAFPDAPGFRTRISLKALREFGKEDIVSYTGGSYTEKLNLANLPEKRKACGYYNDTQHRNRDETPILFSETAAGPLKQGRMEICDRASFLSLEQAGRGLAVLKESHKCANQNGVDTGGFVVYPDRILSTGLGLTPCHYEPSSLWLQQQRFRDCWAHWSLLYTGGESGMQMAIKEFDRLRFCPDPLRIAGSRANTWGTRTAGDEARSAAEEKNVLKEIRACADLGIDSLAIDDGWQYDIRGSSETEEISWDPDPERFPGGWHTVRDAAKKNGVKLELWMPGSIGLDHMLRNIDRGGFTGLKLDFLNLSTKDKIEDIIEKAERITEHTHGSVTISWDCTENAPRLGYFFGREYGTIYPENRKPTHNVPRIRHVTYVPRLVFRDAWHLAHYIHLCQIEIPIQNIDRIDPGDSNAAEYSHAYCTAIAFMGLPLFFQEVHFYDDNARSQIRSILSLYREHRDRIAQGIVFPVGDEPCDSAWSGFQSHSINTGTGYLTLFRELLSQEPEHALQLHCLGKTTLEIKDLISGDTYTAETDAEGKAEFTISRPGDFRILKYRMS